MGRRKGKRGTMFLLRAMTAPLLGFALGAAALSAQSFSSQDPSAPSPNSGQAVDQAQPSAGGQTPPPPPADAASSVRTVRLSYVDGNVQVFEGGQLAFPQAAANMPLVEGMRVVTAVDGRAEVQFEDGSVARVAPNSSLLLANLARNSDGTLSTEIDALTGLTYYELNGRGGGQYAVHFGPDAAVPTGSAVLRVDLDGNPAQVADLQGDVQFLNGQDTVATTHGGQAISFNTDDPSQYSTSNTIAADSWDQWNADRDQQLAAMAQDETTVRAGAGNPDNPAWNDLDYYGDWYDVPGYGQAWAPAGVSADWDPFGTGAWGYYPSFGYTWISGYPWGWWPYHCGAWNYFDSYGWMWFPGSCGWGALGSGWYPYAGVWHVPSGYRPPLRPAHPVHAPGAPLPHPEPLIAVHRGEQFTAGLRTFGGPRPTARVFTFGDATIQPMLSSVHPAQAGPIGETFTNAMQRTHPELGLRQPLSPYGDEQRWRPNAGPGRSNYPGPAHPGATYPAPVYRGFPQGGRVSAPPPPHFSAPAGPHH
jgi:FecR protein